MWRRTLARPLVADMGQRDGDAVDERLAADEAMVGQQVGAKGEMLARAEADFEVERAVVAEQARGADLALVGDRDLRQQVSRPAPTAGTRSLCPDERP